MVRAGARARLRRRVLFTVVQWHAERDWRGDEYDVVLAHARIQ
jgi:hypothetical protein